MFLTPRNFINKTQKTCSVGSTFSGTLIEITKNQNMFLAQNHSF